MALSSGTSVPPCLNLFGKMAICSSPGYALPHLPPLIQSLISKPPNGLESGPLGLSCLLRPVPTRQMAAPSSRTTAVALGLTVVGDFHPSEFLSCCSVLLLARRTLTADPFLA